MKMSNRAKINKKSSFEALLKEASQHCKWCIICHRPADAVGMYVSKDNILNVRMGEKGTAFYGICEVCLQDSQSARKAEAILMRASKADFHRYNPMD
jgi:hypothetical protein